MKSRNKLNQLEREFDYFDYLVTVHDEPYHRGVLENIERRIKAIKRIKNKNSSDTKITERATKILQKYERLKQSYYSMHPKK
jgi:DNA repair ATPase RecN